MMPIESTEVDRSRLILNGLGLSFSVPFHFLDIQASYMWYPLHLNGLIGAVAFLLYGILSVTWATQNRALRPIAAVVLAVCVCISLVFVAATPVLQWYELIIKLSLLAALTGLGIASEKLRQKLVDRLAGDEKEWSPS